MRLNHLFVLVALAAAVSGCGGGGIFNPFIGTYNGGWTQASPGASGNSQWLVVPGGTISGSFHDNGANTDYSISGTINESGVVNATLTPNGGSGTPLAGTMSFDFQNHLTGNLTDTGGPYNTLSFDLTPQ